jgi:hypothetical protein
MSSTVATLLVAFVAVIHVVIAVVEMLFWTREPVHQRLNFTAVEAQKVAPIVANAGLYNSFLAAGLIWALVSYTPGVQRDHLLSAVRHRRRPVWRGDAEADDARPANDPRRGGARGGPDGPIGAGAGPGEAGAGAGAGG